MTSVSQNQLPQARTNIFHPLHQHLFRNVVMDSNENQNQLYSTCMCNHTMPLKMPNVFVSTCRTRLVLAFHLQTSTADNRPSRQVLFEKSDSADPTIDLEPKHVGACAELKVHVVSARDFCFEKEEKNSFWRGNKWKETRKSNLKMGQIA